MSALIEGHRFVADYPHGNGNEPIFRCIVEVARTGWAAFIFDCRQRDAHNKPVEVYSDLFIDGPEHGRALVEKMLPRLLDRSGLQHAPLTWQEVVPNN
jgi:hypothetical protein